MSVDMRAKLMEAIAAAPQGQKIAVKIEKADRQHDAWLKRRQMADEEAYWEHRVELQRRDDVNLLRRWGATQNQIRNAGLV